MAMNRQNGALHNCLTRVRCEIKDILQSGNYYVTEEIAKILTVINNSLDHLFLDNTFLATSKDWQKNPGNYTPRDTDQHHYGALAAVNHVAGNLQTFKQYFCNENVMGKQENQLREVHQWAITSLNDSQKKLESYTYDAADRIKQFGDTLGVTDRYTGFRQNLTRGNRDPFKMQTSWIDKSGELGLMNTLTRSYSNAGSPVIERQYQNRTVQFAGDGDTSKDFSQFGGVPPANIGVLKNQITYGSTNPQMRITRGYRTIDSLYPKSTAPFCGELSLRSKVMDEVKTLNAFNACDLYEKVGQYSREIPATCRRPFENLSAQEQFGISTTFPGKTEYMLQFKAPNTNGIISNFKINPTPDFSIYGRPMQRSYYEPSNTEYQTRYEWPDTNKIATTPWLRN